MIGLSLTISLPARHGTSHACHGPSHALILFGHADAESWRQVVHFHDSSGPASEDHMAALCQQSISSAQATSHFQPHADNANANTPEELEGSGRLEKHMHILDDALLIIYIFNYIYNNT